MRKFIISDIHGNGNVYYSIMNYLDNINEQENITLYINGDLIDRGLDSAEILLDVLKRIEEKKFKIEYLGGNHELLMYQYYKDRKKKGYTFFNNWYDNGGSITDCCLEDFLDYDEDKINRVFDYIGTLNLFHVFEETIDGKPIVLSHAANPFNLDIEKNAQIKNDNHFTEYCVWTRKYDPFIPFRQIIGNENYFSIVGHTPNNNEYGYEYHEDENYLNIDGGSSLYVSGYFDVDHVPLVEIKNEALKILTFNNNNEIIAGNYFIGGKSIVMNEEDLACDRGLLNKQMKMRKLVRLEDDVIVYENACT